MKLSNIIINKITFALFSLVIVIYLGLCSIENGGNESKKYLPNGTVWYCPLTARTLLIKRCVF